MSLCAQALKFLVPFTEKFSNPDYEMPDEALEKLQKMIQELVKEFLESPDDVRQEFRGIADDVESLRRLDDLIQKTRDGFLSANLKTEVLTVRKRLTSIKVILNRDLGKAPRRSSGCVFPLIFLVVLAVTGWVFRGTILEKIQPFLGSQPEVQAPENADAESEDVSEDEADVESETSENSQSEPETQPESVANPEPESESAEELPAESGVKPESGEETSATESQTEESSPEKVKPAKKKGAKKAEFRVWEDLNGKKLRARFVQMDGQATIILEYYQNGKKKGKVLKQKGFAIGNFCEKDQEYIRENYQ